MVKPSFPLGSGCRTRSTPRRKGRGPSSATPAPTSRTSSPARRTKTGSATSMSREKPPGFRMTISALAGTTVRFRPPNQLFRNGIATIPTKRHGCATSIRFESPTSSSPAKTFTAVPTRRPACRRSPSNTTGSSQCPSASNDSVRRRNRTAPSPGESRSAYARRRR